MPSEIETVSPTRGTRSGPSRRGFLATGGVASLAGVLTQRPAAAAERRRRPNILWLVSEDCAASLHSIYGDPLGRTPTIEALAADGVRYDAAFSPAPTCAPTRFSLITGVEATSAAPAQHQRADGKIPAWLRGFPAYLREAGYYCTNNGKEDYNTTIDIAETWDDSSGRAHWRNRPDGAPFFSVFNFAATHESTLHPWRISAGPDHTDPASVEVPSYLPDSPQIRMDRAAFYDNMRQMDGQVARILRQLEEDGLADDTIVMYYADNGGALPRSKWYAYDTGLRVPLVMRFGANVSHLAPAAPGETVSAPVSLTDLPPTMLQLGGATVPDYMQGHVFLGRSPDSARRYSFSHRDRVDERYEMLRAVTDGRFHYIRNYLPHLPWGQHNVYMFKQVGYQEWEHLYREGRLNETQARFWREKPYEEFYDLREDPDQVDNLVGSGRHADVLARMRSGLDDHMLAVNDNGFIPEGSDLEGYEQSREPGVYPLREIMELAELACRRDPASVRRLARGLDHDNEVIRYWAALGCVMLRGYAAAAKGALTDRLTDSSWSVRLVAAEALCYLGDRDRAVAVIAEGLRDGTTPVRLQAGNALDQLGTLALPALSALRAARDAPATRWLATHVVRKLTGAYPWHPHSPDGLGLGVPRLLHAGKASRVDVRLENRTRTAMTSIEMDLRVPDGWTASATGKPPVALPPGQTAELGFDVTPGSPADGVSLLVAQASFDARGAAHQLEWGARAAVGPEAQTVAFLNDASASHDPREVNCIFRWWGDGYPSQELAAAGLTAGAAVKHNGLIFTWPDAAPGAVDNIRTRGQRVPLAGSGRRLGFLGASVYGDQRGAVTVEYADGGTQQGELALPDWYATSAPPETVVATTSYTWRSSRRAETDGSVFFAEIPVDPGRELAAVILPNNVNMHVFDIAVGGA